jgi:SAM-dependent methyltransferase
MPSEPPVTRITPSFPVPLVCPACTKRFDDEDRCACQVPRLEWWHGVPRTLFGQSYWGETSLSHMREVLDLMGSMPWREALRRVCGNEPVYRHLTAGVGVDIVYGMPWDNINTVLEIGSGMGFMTAPLARFARKLIAVEAVPERALFLRKRAEQEKWNNVYPLLANGTDLPFEPESFDLICMNGVFEYLGLWETGDPQEVQQKFLATVHRLLKPSGYFYIGIETRYGAGAWLGGRDHSGLRYTSLMPRLVADWYCRVRKTPFYGSSSAAEGYRLYTHTAKQYEGMFRQAGFPTVEVYGCFDGYNRQVGLYPLRHYAAYRQTRRVVDPPSSLLGHLFRTVRTAPLWYDILEDEVAILGCKKPNVGRLLWSGIRSAGPVAQLNTRERIGLVTYEGPRPKAIAKAGKSEKIHARLEREYQFLLAAHAKLGEEADSWSLRWPKPLGPLESHGIGLCQFEFAQGESLSKFLSPHAYGVRRLSPLVKQLTRGYTHMTSRMNEALAHSTADWAALLEQWGSVRFGRAALDERTQHACHNLRGRPWQPGIMHGDLAFNNVILLDDGQMVLIDWDNFSENGLAAIDLVRLLYDAWKDSALFGDQSRARLMAIVRDAVTAALQDLNVAESDWRDVEHLFIAHQFQFDFSRYADVTPLLEAYSDPAFTVFA